MFNYHTYLLNLCLDTAASSQNVSKMGDAIPHYIREYANSLKELYISKPPFPQPDWPQTKAEEATKLVIIKIDHDMEHCEFPSSETETQEHDYVHGKIDNIVGYKKEIELANLLDPVHCTDSDKPPKVPRVLMDGAPGVGKTTLTIKACADWAEGRLFQQYYLVILVPLRYRKAMKYEDLFPNCHNDFKEVIKYISKCNGKNIAFIFDGYDELSYKQREEDSIFLDIIRGDDLPKCAVIVTSRPYASGYLKSLRSINRHVEVVGFKKEQIYSCVRRNVCNKSSANILIGQLEERDDILSLCYIPLNCVIMIQVYEKNQMLPTTMTELFVKFVLDTVTRDVTIVHKSATSKKGDLCKLDSLSEPISKLLRALSKLAYGTLLEDRFIFTYNELRTVFADDVVSDDHDILSNKCLGLVTSVSRITGMNTEHYQFLHLSIQEFLAARFALSTYKLDEQQPIIDILFRFVNNSRFKLFLIFFAGMAHLPESTAQILFNLHVDQSSEQFHFERKPSYFLFFAHMIFESQQFELFDCLLKSLHDKSTFSLQRRKLSQFDCMVLAHFFCNTDNSWKKLNLTDCSLTIDSLNVFHNVYKQQTSKKHKTTFECVDLSENDPKMVKKLDLFPWLYDVKELKFQCFRCDCQLNERCVDLSFLVHIPKLDIRHGSHCQSTDFSSTYYLESTCILRLDLCNESKKIILYQANLGEAFEKRLKDAESIELCKTDCNRVTVSSLKSCQLYEVDGINMCLIRNMSNFVHCKRLTTLKLSDSKVCLTSEVALQLFQSLQNNTSITELNLSIRMERHNLGKALRNYLSVNKTVKKLELHNIVDDSLAEDLKMGLKRNTSLEYLNVKDNSLSINTIQGVICAMISCPLIELAIEDVKLTKNNSGETLEIGSRYVTPKVFCALANLKMSESISRLSLSFVNDHLSSLDFVRVFNALQSNQHVDDLYMHRHFNSIEVCATIGCSMKAMLIFNHSLKTLCLESCHMSDVMCECLAAGLRENTSIRKLSLKQIISHSSSGIAKILEALQGSRSMLEKLDLSDNLGVFSNNDVLLSEAFEKLLEVNCTIVKLNLRDSDINDALAQGIANGLCKNVCLKKLKVSLSLLSPRGIANLMLSLTKSALIMFNIVNFCLLTRRRNSGWDFDVYKEDAMLQNVFQYIFCKREEYINLNSFVVKDFGIWYFCQVRRILSHLSVVSGLKTIRLSKLRAVNPADTPDDRGIGNALKELLSTSSSLEDLTLQDCNLSNGRVWIYAAKGLRKNNSLKKLNLSHCKLSAEEAVSIFHNLKENSSLLELDISENDNVRDDGSAASLGNAIEMCLKHNNSIQIMNLKNSLDDEVAKKVVTSLHTSSKTSLRKLCIDEQHLSCDTVKQLIRFLRCSNLKELEFDQALLTNGDQDMWSVVIGNKELLLHTHEHITSCKSFKVFSSLCSIQNEEKFQATLNVTELVIDEINDDAAYIIFSSLANGCMSHMTKLVLNTKHTIHSNTFGGCPVGHKLKEMLVSNKSLVKLILQNFDEDVMQGIIEGLPKNSKLVSLHLLLDANHINVVLNDLVTANLLKALDSTNIGLLELQVSGIPPIHRHKKESIWTMKLPESDPFNWYVSRNGYPHLHTFILILCDIYNGIVIPTSETAKSVLDSWPTLRLPDVTVCSALKVFDMLTTNCTIKELDLSNNNKLVVSGDEKLSNSIHLMLKRNHTLKVLNVSGSLNHVTATGLAKGLKLNVALEHLLIDARNVKLTDLSAIVHSLDVCALKELTVTKVCCIKKCDSKWQVTILDHIVWPLYLTVLEKISPHPELLKVLKIFPNIQYSMTFEIQNYQLSVNATSSEKTSFCIQKLPEDGVKYLTMSSQDDSDDKDSKSSPSSEIQRMFSITQFTSLKLNQCNVTDGVVKMLALSKLKVLDLGHNSIQECVTIELFKLLASNCTLEELDISHTSVNTSNNTECKDFALALEGLLTRNTKLKVLSMKNCDINDSVAPHIGAGLRNNKTLVCLNLSCNKLSIDGAVVVCESVEKNQCLIELNLSSSQLVVNKHLNCALCRMLKCNTVLTTLILDCKFKDELLTELVPVLKQNASLRNLTLNNSYCYCHKNIFTTSLFQNLGKIHLNFSDSCSLVTSDRSGSRIKLEIQSSRAVQVMKNLYEAGLGSEFDVVVSKTSAPVLNLENFGFSSPEILLSIRNNTKLKQVTLNLRHCINYDTIGNALKSMLTTNTTVAHLVLYEVNSDNLVSSIIAGIQMNHCIETLCIKVVGVSDSMLYSFFESIEATNNALAYVNVIPVLTAIKVNFHWFIERSFCCDIFLKFYRFCAQKRHVKSCIITSMLKYPLPTAAVQTDISKPCRRLNTKFDSMVDIQAKNTCKVKELEFLPCNGKRICDVADAMECGRLSVDTITFKFGCDSNKCEYAATAIVKILQSKSLQEVYIKDKRSESEFLVRQSDFSGPFKENRWCLENSELSKEIFITDLHNSSVLKLQYCGFIILEKKINDRPVITKPRPTGPRNAEANLDSLKNSKPAHPWVVTIEHNSAKLYFYLLLRKIANYPVESVGQLVFQSLKHLNLSNCCLNSYQLIAMFEALKDDTHIIYVNVSFCCSNTKLSSTEVHAHYALEEMLKSNKTLETLNLTGIVDDKFATAIIDGLPKSSLKTLTIDLNTRAYGFRKVECMLDSFFTSSLKQLRFAGVCLIEKYPSSWCFHLTDSTFYHLNSPWQKQMLRSHSSMFMLTYLCKLHPNSNLTLYATRDIEYISIKIFQWYFFSVRDGDQHVAATEFINSLNQLQLAISLRNTALVTAVFESLCNNRHLEHLHNIHDVGIPLKSETFDYKRLLSSNQVLQNLTVSGEVDDKSIKEIANGLQCNRTLTKLSVNNSSVAVSTETLTFLLQAAKNSGLTQLYISDKCVIQYNHQERASQIRITEECDSVFKCQLFCACVQAKYFDSKSLAPLVQNERLDLKQNSKCDPSIHVCGSLVSTLFDVVSDAKVFVSELNLSENFLEESDEYEVHLGFELLLSNSSLKVLKLDRCRISNMCCKSIANGLSMNKALKSLDLSSNYLTSSCVGELFKAISSNESLLELDLYSAIAPDVVNEGLNILGSNIKYMLTRNQTLTKLCLDSCYCDEWCSFIAKGLSANESLKVLSLRSCLKREDSLAMIIKSLECNKTLEELDVSQSSVTMSVGYAIQCMLKQNTNLSSLNVSRCDISDDVCKLINNGMASNQHLHRLDLSGNRICGSGVVDLFKVLESNQCKLKELDLSLNKVYPHIDYVTRDEVLNMYLLKENTTLTVLKVPELTPFSIWFGLQLFKGLKDNTTLLELDISGTYLDEETSTAFTDMISHNTTLSVLNIAYCNSYYGTSIAEVLKKSSSIREVIVEQFAIQHYKSVLDETKIKLVLFKDEF